MGDTCEQVASKLDEILNRFDRVEENLSNKITELRTHILNEITLVKNDLNSYKVQVSTKIDDLGERILAIEGSQTFISTKYDEQKTFIDEMKKRENKNEGVSIVLNDKIRKLERELKEEKIRRNEDAQYIRSSFMVELSNLPPYHEEEDIYDLIKRIATLADFKFFNTGQIDVAHRISQKPNAPVIVMFSKKCYRQNFYEQRFKLKFVHVNQLIDEVATYPDPDAKRDANTFIYLNESLTPINRDLFIQAKEILREKRYPRKIRPFTVKGQVRVRLSNDKEQILIRCIEDLKKIV